MFREYITVDDILTWKDLLIAPIVLFVIYQIAKRWRNRNYRFSTAKKYFLPAFSLRMIGCFLSACMYQYYYHGGDTFGYFEGVKLLHFTLFKDFSTGLEMMFQNLDNYSDEAHNFIRESIGYWHFKSYRNVVTMQLGALFGLLCFGSYLSIGFILTFFSFMGCWRLFEVFKDIYPHLEKQMAVATLFIPSVFFWGAAGLLKDTVTMAAIGFFVWGIYFGLIKRTHFFKGVFMALFSFYIIATVKSYIALAFVPAVMVWIFLLYRGKIKNKLLRNLSTPIFLALGVIMGLFTFQKISSSIEERFSQEQILEYALNVQSYHARQTKHDDGSGYDLGTIDTSLLGMIKAVPASINVTLFRPYVWEVRKPILLPSVLEALVSLLFTLYVFFKVGIWKTIRALFSDPNVLFCLIFSLIFAFAVGFSTYNFGALARYKIPCMPFFFIALFALLDKAIKKKIRKKVVRQNI